MFFKRRYEDTVELSYGVVKLKPLTNGIVNKAYNFSSVGDGIFSNNIFFTTIELLLTGFSKRKYNNLSIRDGNILREKIKEILKRYGLLEDTIIKEETDKPNMFSKQEIEWFEDTARKMKNGR